MNNTILTILSLSVSGSILALILLALRPLLKNKVSKAFQYYIWLLVLLRLALPLSFDNSIMNRVIPQVAIQAPVVSAPDDSALTQGQTQNNGQNASQGASETALSGVGTSNSGSPAAQDQTQFDIWKFAMEHLTAIWLLGALVHFGWFVIAYLRFSRKIRKTSVLPHLKDMEVFEELRGNMSVRLACNPYIDTPMLIGFPSPCIIIPHLAFAVNGMKPELRHILRHELTHYCRRDLLYKWFGALVSSLHWFNPLMIIVRRELSRACELSCDEAVVRSLNLDERQDYGETLLAIASNKRLPKGVVTTTMCEEKRKLKERLESIMTYKSKNVLMVALSLVLALMFAGCSVALGAAKLTVNTQAPDATSQSPVATTGSPTIPEGDASQSPAATDAANAPADTSSDLLDGSNGDITAQISSNDPVLEAYSAVLRNKAEFFSTDSKRNLYLNDFLTNKEIYGADFKITRFAVLDMDGDNAPEVVLELSAGGEPQFYEVLHNTDGKVNGYLVVYRGLEQLKADGTFLFSNGAADYGWGRMLFKSDAFDTGMLAYSQSSQDGSDLTISYFINNEQVTKESFDAFTSEQSGKADAVWYEFSQKNIEAELISS